MKKILLSLLVVSSVTFASEIKTEKKLENLNLISPGEKVFNEKCSMCHNLKMSSELMTGQRFAPSMIDVANRMKKNIIVPDEDIQRFTMISFIKEYVKNPSFDYSIYDNTGVNPYDLMPKINISEKELSLVATWVYDEVSNRKFK
jgi:hypothetical protein